MGPIRLIVADSQNIIRFGVRYIVESQYNLKIIGEAEDWQALLSKTEMLKPDVIVLDPYSIDGLELSEFYKLKEQHSAVRYLIVSDKYGKDRVNDVLALGIHAFVTKACSKEEIINAIYAVSKDEKFFCNKVLNVILDHNNTDEEDCEPTDLTPREIEIVKLITDGLNSARIADKLCLSKHTVYTHRKNIMKKLQVKNVSELVMQAVNSGIVNTL